MSKTITPVLKNGTHNNGKKNVAAPPMSTEVTVSSELPEIPYLGATRKIALAEAGIRTLGDLRAATVEQIGGVKGVGMINAARVKEWLSAQDVPVPIAEDSVSAIASANQDVQDVFQKIGSATARLKETIAPKARDKALDRQLDKLDNVASELAEGPDTLSAKRVQEAVKTLDKIAALLEAATKAEKMTPKKQAVLIEELRARRKRLQKTIGD